MPSIIGNKYLQSTARPLSNIWKFKQNFNESSFFQSKMKNAKYAKSIEKFWEEILCLTMVPLISKYQRKRKTIWISLNWRRVYLAPAQLF